MTYFGILLEWQKIISIYVCGQTAFFFKKSYWINCSPQFRKIYQFCNFCCSLFVQMDASLFALFLTVVQKVTSCCWARRLGVNLRGLHVGATASSAALTSHFSLLFRLACP